MTELLIPCPECGKALKLRDRKLLGRRGRCPRCKHMFVLAEPEEVEFELADAAALNFYLGLLELVIAGVLILGYKIRFFSMIASLLIAFLFISFFTKYGFSINPDLYRDIGLLAASIILFLLGAGPWSIDRPDL